MKSLSRIRLFMTPWTVAYQAPPSMEFSRQEYWNGLPFPSPGYLPKSGIESGFPALREDALLSEPPGKPLCLLPFPAAALPRSSWGSALCIFGTKDPGAGGVIHSIAEPTGSFTMLWGPAEEGAADASTPPGGGREMQPGAKDFCNSFPIGKNHYFATWFVPGTPVFLLGESQGRGSLVGCRLWGRTESDTTEVT